METKNSNQLEEKKDGFIPGLRYHWLTKYYDLFIKNTLPEISLKNDLIEHIGDINGKNVLDIGCGTGTLTILAKKTNPSVNIIGLDLDPKMVARAKEKASQENLQIEFKQGTVTQLPFDDLSFDYVISSLMIHHLTTDQKINTFKEVNRILKKNGELHILDFGKPKGFLANLISMIMRNFEQTKDGILGKIPLLLHEADLICTDSWKNKFSIFGTLSLFTAYKK